MMAVLLTGSLAGDDMAVPYRANQKNDGYIAEKCLLDYALPEGEKDFATVVWFHGGGINSGNKSIPEKLNEANYNLPLDCVHHVRWF